MPMPKQAQPVIPEDEWVDVPSPAIPEDEWVDVDPNPRTPVSGKPTAPNADPGFVGQLPSWAQEALKMRGAFTGKLAQAATMGNFTPPGTEEFAAEYPKVGMAGSGGGMVANAAAMGPLAKLIGAPAGIMGKMGMNAAQGGVTGAMQKPEGEDTLANRAKGGLVGSTISTVLPGMAGAIKMGGGATKALAGRAARFTPNQADAYLKDPKAVSRMAGMLDDPTQIHVLQDEAKQALQSSRKQLKSKGMQKASELRKLLTGKSVDVDPQATMGINPQVDQMISSKVPKYMGMPNKVALEANEANQAKRLLQGEAKFQPGTVTDPVQAARQAKAAGSAANIRGGIEALDPSIRGTNEAMQEGMMLQEALRKGQKSNPLAFIGTESPDRIAALSRAEKAGGGGLLDFGSKLGAAKSMTTKDVDDAVTRALVKKAGRATLRANAGVGRALAPLDMTDPTKLQGILNLIQTNRSSKE